MMECKKCGGRLEVLRACWKIGMKCGKCNTEFHIHEVSDQLDAETEALLEQFPSIIYD
jgi:DNA-directed RNA polymerase subunit M/transcription elongation factor TFIIS